MKQVATEPDTVLSWLNQLRGCRWSIFSYAEESQLLVVLGEQPNEAAYYMLCRGVTSFATWRLPLEGEWFHKFSLTDLTGEFELAMAFEETPVLSIHCTTVELWNGSHA